MKKLSKSSNWIIVSLFLLISVILIGLLSYSSPMYEFNYSGDNNNYMTVGKSMMHGIVPYKDLFEQKGPYVYLIYGLASKISFETFIGSAVFEILILTLIIWLTYKIARLYLQDYLAFGVSLFVPVFVFMQPFYTYGATVEFFVFPAILSLIYLTLKSGRQNFEISKLDWFIQGFLVGVVFFSKYTLLGSWIAFYLIIFGIYLYQRRFPAIAKLFWSSLSGFILATVPWLIYFWIENGLQQFFDVYFYTNIFMYGSVNGNGLTRLINSISTYIQFLVTSNPVITGLVLVAIFTLYCNRRVINNKATFKVIVAMMLTNAILAVIGGTFGAYYLLAYFPYLVLAYLLLVVALNKKGMLKSLHAGLLTTILLILGSIFMTISVNQNLQYSKLFPNNPAITNHGGKKVQESAQIKFGKIMKNESDGRPTLLTFGFLENGFYTTSGAYPNVRFFERNNIPYKKYPQMLDDAAAAIEKKKTQWVVIVVDATTNNNLDYQIKNSFKKHVYKRGINALNDSYEIRAHHAQFSQGNQVEYVLYKLK
ncbi:teichoic acid glycosyl transferase [Fructilactobacillus vespulae]|uniref:ArnT family glycosyltransferase n=1 Tax=Fructilactobacillus vespulae TaxID=1249630 RepID=UPI0039B516F0